MTTVAQPLRYHRGKISPRLTKTIKRRREKPSVVPTRTPVGVTDLTMYDYARTAIRPIGCIDCGTVATRRGGAA